ncbi:phenylacetate--CoA ligase family protein [Chloroflexota bacterium]
MRVLRWYARAYTPASAEQRKTNVTQMYNFIARHILAQLLDHFRGTQTMKCLGELEDSQWWPRDKLLELQNQRLKELIKHAYDNVPYYRRVFDERSLKPIDIQRGEDLVKLPLLNKQLMRTRFTELMSQDFSARKPIRLSTGGSTGEPLSFYRTRYDQLNWGFAATQRALGWAGYELGDKLAKLQVRRPYKSKLAKFSQISKDVFQRTILFDVKEMSLNTLPLLVNKLEGIQPKFIYGYPSAIELLARFTEKEGRSRLKPKAIITSAEQLYDYQRNLFHKAFECETYSCYSSWEVHAIAAECTEHSGYHIVAENIIVEIVDERGDPVSTGEEGRIVITNLHNYAMPFIRYDIGDLGVGSDSVCSCGRGLPIIAQLSGRTTDVIFTRNGKTVPGTALLHVFLAPLDIAQFQIVQESYDKMVIKLVMGKECTNEHLDELTTRIINQYKLILGEEINILVEFVDHIPTTSDGKRRVVVSKVLQNSELSSGLDYQKFMGITDTYD